MTKEEGEKALKEFTTPLATFIRHPEGTFLRLNKEEGAKLYFLLKDFGGMPDDWHRA